MDGHRDSGSGKSRFQTTHWSLIRAAADSADPRAQEALARLCQVYWHPVYAFIRSRGNDAESSKELTQSFFADFLDRKHLQEADRERGRFRSFLLACVKNFVSKERRRARAQKRGGGVPTLHLDFQDAEALYGTEVADLRTPEKIFEKQWALSTLGHALRRLEEEMAQRGSLWRFRQLRPFLTGDDAETSYEKAAAALKLSEGAVKVAVHRLRRRFGRLLREELAQTVADPTLVDEELRFLLDALKT